MASGQQFLFAPEKPLVTRLGKKFFRDIPGQAGVYKMRDAHDNIVYVGKAKNLRQRLRSYRVANPERMGRRHLRLLQQVTRIEFDLCPDERTALKHEARLIRNLKPKFNRAGAWQGKPQFLTWRFADRMIQFAIQETPQAGWERFGSLGAYAPRLKMALVRLLWLALNPEAGIDRLPHGWSSDRLVGMMMIHCRTRDEEVKQALTNAFWGDHQLFLTWLEVSLNSPRAVFERNAIARDVEEIQSFFGHSRWTRETTAQMTLL